jgi:hypothetical protein
MKRLSIALGPCTLLAACVAQPSARDELSGSVILVVIGIIAVVAVAVAISRRMRSENTDRDDD